MATAAVRYPTRALRSDNEKAQDSYSSASLLQATSAACLKSDSHSVQEQRYLAVSFYLEPDHLLDLQTVDTPNRLFAQALTMLQTVSDDYAVRRYEDVFDWPAVFSRLRELAAKEKIEWRKQEFYVVEFRSKLKEHIDRNLLFKLDKESHREATQAGGLLKYWYGSPDNERRNLATCLWRGKEDALLGGQGMWHKQARGVIGEMYESINVSGLRLIVEEDMQNWAFEPFSFH